MPSLRECVLECNCFNIIPYTYKGTENFGGLIEPAVLKEIPPLIRVLGRYNYWKFSYFKDKSVYVLCRSIRPNGPNNGPNDYLKSISN